MTLFDFIYMVGFSVSFIMGLSAIISLDKEQKEEVPFPAILFCALFCGVLSWGLPIYWIGREIYERKFRK